MVYWPGENIFSPGRKGGTGMAELKQAKTQNKTKQSKESVSITPTIDTVNVKNTKDSPAIDPDDISPKEISKMEAQNSTGVLIDSLSMEMRRGYREIELEQVGKIRIYLPDAAIDQQLSDIKAELITALLESDKIITKEQVLDKLRKRDLWDDKREEKEKVLTQDILDIMRDIMYEQHNEKIDVKNLKSLRKRRRDLEQKRTELTATRDYFVVASLESKVDTMLFKHQLVFCIKVPDEDGNVKPLWETIEDLEHDSRKYVVNRLSTLSGYFWNGWSEDLLHEALDI